MKSVILYLPLITGIPPEIPPEMGPWNRDRRTVVQGHLITLVLGLWGPWGPRDFSGDFADKKAPFLRHSQILIG